MKRTNPLTVVMILAVVTGAVAVRVVGLQERPMHVDEAVHAVKFGALLEKGDYTYDPREYHGPTLNYFSLIACKLGGQNHLAEVTETPLRLVVAFFGVGIILLHLAWRQTLGKGAAVISALLVALSPIMVFYSRYYIQETLLVFFTFGAIVCGHQWYRKQSLGWAALTGVFLGLMYATKETCIIAWGALLGAAVISKLWAIQPSEEKPKPFRMSTLLVGIAAFALVASVFYSSFFSNPQGVIDSLSAFKLYFHRAGNHDWHLHPWYYYLKMLIWSQYFDGPVFSELLIVILGIVGIGAAFHGKGMPTPCLGLARFIALYTILMAVIYSAIPYKTPWCMLGFVHGLIILAGWGAWWLVRQGSSSVWRGAMIGLITLGMGHLAWQSYQANFVYEADVRNPYVYAHTTKDIPPACQEIIDLSQASPAERAVHIQVICPEDDYWPLPWYLRHLKNVGYWSGIPQTTLPGDIIIASPRVEEALLAWLYETPPPGQRHLYVPLFPEAVFLRPGVELRGYVSHALWNHQRDK